MPAHFHIDAISPHILYRQAVKSEAAIRLGLDNTPGIEALKAMQAVARECYERLWTITKGRIVVSSFYRSPPVNTVIGGSKTSQHMKGQAIDIDAVGSLTNAKLLEFALALPVFDQVISEYGTVDAPAWIHVSYVEGGPNRRMFLRIGQT